MAGGERVVYRAGAAAEYERFNATTTAQTVPTLLHAAHIASGQQVLDIATGTGVAAEAAATAVGPTGRVVAADLSPAMLVRARERLTGLPAVVGLVAMDGQSLAFCDGAFDAVLCHLGLMFFPEPARGLSEFRRVLCVGGSVAVSVVTTPERSLFHRVNAAIGRRAPALVEASSRLFALGKDGRLGGALAEAGFAAVEISAVTRRIRFGSFDEYFAAVERGAGSPGQAYAALDEDARRAVREEVQRELNDTGGPLEIEVETRFGSGRR